MVRIRLMVQSTPKAHPVLTENMSEEDADRALEDIAEKLGTAHAIKLPGVTVLGGNVLSAEKVHPSRPRAGSVRLA